VADEDRLHPDFEDLWPGSRARIDEALAAIARGVEALEAGALPEDLRAEAEARAHKLVGTLGAYGLMRSALLARELEDAFRAGPAAADGARLREHLDAVVAAVQSAS
jgi:HPt (histidine-containing phosphotransfer) domain-containing protein